MSQFTTNDMSLAAYLIMRGCALKTANKLGKTFRFTFDLGERCESTLQIEYVNSESAKFDDAVRNLKKIMYSSNS